MNLSNRGYILALALTVLSVVLTLTDFGILRTLFTLPLVFALPGYAMLAAWSPKRLVTFPANILFTLMLSIAATAVGGLVLNLTPPGLQTVTWTIWLASVTLLHLAAALMRRESTPTPFDLPTRFRPYQLAFIVGAVALGFFALYLARQGAMVQERPGFTQLWLTQGQSSDWVDVGVQNQEGQTLGYRLVLESDGVSEPVEREIELAQNERWEISFELPEEYGQTVNAYLYRLDNPEAVYRTTRLWLPDAE